MTFPAAIADKIARSSTLLSDLGALADCGGRLAGSTSEMLSRQWLVERLGKITSVIVREQGFEYQGWRRRIAQLRLSTAPQRQLSCHSLLLSPDTPVEGLEAEVVDVGRGTMADFDFVKAALNGRIALVQHEYPFAMTSIHRRVKYNRSREEGCVGFIIANYLPDGGLVTGSSGQGTSLDIPAIGIGYKDRGFLARKGKRFAGVRLDIKSERFPTQGKNIIVDVPGKSSETVILCAHYDGHDLAESALDNASGLAAAIQIVESLIPYTAFFRRNLRVIFFTNEEWRLFGSRTYVDGLTEDEVRGISMVINLDTLAGSSQLTALTSGFDEIANIVMKVSSSCGRNIPTFTKVLENSDHFNFVRRGVPAMRLIAGFDEPEARTRYLLTEGDRRDKIQSGELKSATVVAAAITWEALTQDFRPKHKSMAEVQKLL
jgi:aminopeptidase YwaD